MPLRVCTVQRGRIGDWLPGLQRALDRKRGYAHTPIEWIEGWTGMENLFDSVLVFEPAAGPGGDAAQATNGAPALVSQAYPAQTRVAMELHVAIRHDALVLGLVYKAARDERRVMQTLLEHLKVLLQGLAENPDRNPVALAMQTPSEARERMWKTLDGEQR